MSQSLEQEEQAIKSAQKRGFSALVFPEALEQEFRRYRHERLLRRVPIIGVCAIILFLLFALLDVFILPEAAYIITSCIRLFLICPLIAIAIIAAKQNWSISAYNWYYFSAYAIAGLSIVAIIYTARINDFLLPYDGVLLHLVFGYFLMGMPYTFATLGGIIVTVSYIAVELHLNTPKDHLASNSLFIITLNIMGSMGSYLHDRARRQLFLNKKLVELAMKKDEQEIEAKTKLVATASHDLRQPLHAMNILVEALESENKSASAPSNSTKLTQNLKESLRQLSQLLTSLLDISRFNAKIVQFSPQTIELSSLIKTLMHDQEIRSKELNIQISTNGPIPCFVKTDPPLLERIFRNLCENVYEHANASCIEVSWFKQGDTIRLQVKDNGKGISEQDIDAIFEEYHQAEHSSKNGMGLGLAIVKQCCEIMNCEYGVSSKSGEGATFWIELAQAYAPDPSNQDEQAPRSNHKLNSSDAKQNILIVDRDESVRQSLEILLSKWGYDTLACTNPEAALEQLRHKKFDLLITDFHFSDSDLDGLALICTARAGRNQRLPAIAITADSSSNISEPLSERIIQDSDITEIAFKPLKPAKLKLMISHLIEA